MDFKDIKVKDLMDSATVDDTTENSLEHYGRRGMKWGKNVFGDDERTELNNRGLLDNSPDQGSYNRSHGTQSSSNQSSPKQDDPESKQESTDKKYELSLKVNSGKNALARLGINVNNPRKDPAQEDVDDNNKSKAYEDDEIYDFTGDNNGKKSVYEETKSEQKSEKREETKLEPDYQEPKFVDDGPERSTQEERKSSDTPTRSNSIKSKQVQKNDPQKKQEQPKKKEEPKKKQEQPKKKEEPKKKQEEPKKKQEEPKKKNDISDAEYNKKLDRDAAKLRKGAEIANTTSTAITGVGKINEAVGGIKNRKQTQQEIDSMDNAQMRKAIERLTLENTYKSLTKSRRSAGHQMVQDFCDTAAPVASVVGTGLTIAALIKELMKK